MIKAKIRKLFLWLHGIMKKNVISAFDEAWNIMHDTDKIADLF